MSLGGVCVRPLVDMLRANPNPNLSFDKEHNEDENVFHPPDDLDTQRGEFEGKRGRCLSLRDDEKSVSAGRHRGSDLCERQVAEKQLWSGWCVRLLLLTCQNEQACNGFSVEVKPPRRQKSSCGTSLTCFGHAQTTLGGRFCGSAHKLTLTFSKFQQTSRSRATPYPPPFIDTLRKPPCVLRGQARPAGGAVGTRSHLQQLAGVINDVALNFGDRHFWELLFILY